MRLQETIVGALRRVGLLSFYDSCKYRILLWALARDRRAAQRASPDFALPPPALAYDAYAHIRYHEYRESGRQHAQLVADIINKNSRGERLDILEWGCGPARVIRHLHEFVARPVHLTGSDFNKDSISWCCQHIRGIEFVENRLEPPLPLEADRFDIVYALSVFTHLSEILHHAWRDELARVLKPGGILILTLHGDCFRDRHLNARERSDYDRGRLVVRGRVEVGKKWYAAFHPPDFVRQRLLRGFDILGHQPGPISAGFEQDIWVARKK